MRLALLLAFACAATLGSCLDAQWPALFAASLFIALTACLRKLEVPKLAAIPLALSVWALLQTAANLTACRQASLLSAVHWAAASATFLAASNLLASPRQRLAALTAFAGFGGLIAFFALCQPQLTGVNPDTMAGPFLNRNTYACFAELAFPPAMWLALRRSPARWLWRLASLALIASVVHTGSRAGSVLILAEAGVMAIYASPRARVALAAATAAICLLLSATLWTRLQYNEPLIHRREIYTSALEMIAEKPVAGHGMGAFQSAYPRFAAFDTGRVVNHAHNDWLETAATGGIPAVLALLAFFAWNCRRVAEHPWAYGILAILVHALVDFPLQRIGVFAWLFLLIGALDAACAPRSSGQAMNAQPRRRQLLTVQAIASV